jgi:hypothetical protein
MIEWSAKEEFHKQRGFGFHNTIGTPQGHKNTQNYCREHVENDHRPISRIPSTIPPAKVKREDSKFHVSEHVAVTVMPIWSDEGT